MRVLHSQSHCPQVSEGLCEAAVKAPGDNRYCNLFPFDASRVVLTGLNTSDYINASWVEMPGLEEKLILTMAPLHPDSQELRRHKYYLLSSNPLPLFDIFSR